MSDYDKRTNRKGVEIYQLWEAKYTSFLWILPVLKDLREKSVQLFLTVGKTEAHRNQAGLVIPQR